MEILGANNQTHHPNHPPKPNQPLVNQIEVLELSLGLDLIDSQSSLYYFFLDLDNIIMAKMAQTVDEAGNKLWQCTDCGHARERKSDIQRHVERKHIEMQVACNLCGVVFSTRLSLKEHMKYKH